MEYGSIVGIGGLGCPALIQLVENWPKSTTLELTLIDDDVVELSNLNRQILFSSDDIATPKAETAIEKITKFITPWPEHIRLTFKKLRLDKNNIHSVLSNSSFILDCTDDVPCKLLLNEYAIIKDKILVYAGVQGTQGLVQLISKERPCLTCSFGEVHETEACELGGACRAGGVIGSIAGITAIHQVEELLHELTLRGSKGQSKKAEIIMINELGQSRLVTTEVSPTCPCGCGFTPKQRIDLSHLSCPETFLFSKISLERVKTSNSCSYAEILFSNESDLNNVALSIEQEGYKIVKKFIKPEFAHFSIVIGIG